MIQYNKYSYIYPPRPKNAIPISELDFWDNGLMVAQPKLNGSNCLIFTNGHEFRIMNRHGQPISNFKMNINELKELFRCSYGNWVVINGEYLNKSKTDEIGHIFNNKLVIFDLLVFNSNYLTGTKFKDRIELMDSIFGTVDSEKDYLYKISENIYRVKSYESNFRKLFEDITVCDLVEGIVLKRKNALLEAGRTESNNTKSQIKIRKQTKNYKF